MSKLSPHLTKHITNALNASDHKSAGVHLGHALRSLKKAAPIAPVQEGGEPDDADPDDTADERSLTGDMRGGSGQATSASKGKTTEPAPKGQFFGQFSKPANAPQTPARRPNAPGSPAPKPGKLAGLLRSMKK